MKKIAVILKIISAFISVKSYGKNIILRSFFQNHKNGLNFILSKLLSTKDITTKRRVKYEFI